MTLKLKYAIKKKVNAHNKKARKLAKKNPHLRAKIKKDPGIPNLWPYKEAMLERHAMQQQKLEEKALQQKEARKRERERRRKELLARKNLPDAPSETAGDEKELRLNQKDVQRHSWFRKELKQVAEVADVVLEVLDARDPLGCRAPKFERLILGKYSESAPRPKRIILVLNKIDLVPKEAVDAWMKYLRREFPVIAFKASTQSQKHLSHSNASASSRAIKGNACIGASELMRLIKQYSLKHGHKQAITVGVIGYPNVGKSSVINSLKRQKSVGVGANPGFTKSVQMVKLDSMVNIMDSPGVLFEDERMDAHDTTVGLALRNCLRPEQIEDPSGIVTKLVPRCNRELLMELYKIAHFASPDEFLVLVAQKLGKLKRGGIADLDSAARAVLRDWNIGKIPYYYLPPPVHDNRSTVSVVQSWAGDFDINQLLDDNAAAATASLTSLADRHGTPYMTIDSDLGALKQSFEQNAAQSVLNDVKEAMLPSDIAMQADAADSQTGAASSSKALAFGRIKKNKQQQDDDDSSDSDGDTFEFDGGFSPGKRSTKSNDDSNPVEAADEFNPQVNRSRAKQLKKQRKKAAKAQRRNQTTDEDMSGATGADDGMNDAYDFATDWN
jgi:nuclear GTP-binding protein